MDNTNGVYVVYSWGSGGQFVGSLVDRIRNINSLCTIDNETGSVHLQPNTTGKGLYHKKHNVDNYTTSNINEIEIIPNIVYDPYIINTHLDIHKINSIFTNTKFIRIFIDPKDDLIIDEKIYHKTFVQQYMITGGNKVDNIDILNEKYKNYRNLESYKIVDLYKDICTSVNLPDVPDPRYVDINLYHQIIKGIKNIRSNHSYFRFLETERKDILQINAIDLFNRNYSTVDKITTFLGKSLTTEHRQLVCNLMDEYADKQPSFEKMKEIYNEN
jgi:hypothetical protein